MSIAAIFDLDGTLIDSRQDLTKAINLMRHCYDLPALPLNTVCGFIGNGARKLVERALAGTDIDMDQALTRMKEFYLAHIADQTRLYDGVADGLKQLHAAGIKLGVITNKPDAAAKQLLSILGVAGLFDKIIGGGTTFPLKPEPDALLYFLDKFDCDPAVSWMVGDHYTDLEAGRRAGMLRCLVKYGFGNPKKEAYELEIDKFADFTAACLPV